MLIAPDALQQCRAGFCSSWVLGAPGFHQWPVSGAATALALFGPVRRCEGDSSEPAPGLCRCSEQHLWAGEAEEQLRCQAQEPRPGGWAAGSVVTSWSRTSVN